MARPLTNPLTVGSLLGLLLALTGFPLPAVVRDPLELVGGMAVPSMLIAYGISLRLGPRPGHGTSAAEVGLISVLKLVVQPADGVPGGAVRARASSAPALLAVTVLAALPTAQNIFVHATRYGRGEVLARDSIFVTTLASVPVVLVIAAVLG